MQTPSGIPNPMTKGPWAGSMLPPCPTQKREARSQEPPGWPKPLKPQPRDVQKRQCVLLPCRQAGAILTSRREAPGKGSPWPNVQRASSRAESKSNLASLAMTEHGCTGHLTPVSCL